MFAKYGFLTVGFLFDMNPPGVTRLRPQLLEPNETQLREFLVFKSFDFHSEANESTTKNW